jgi:branched-chain amino acid transport system permease protein
VRFIAFSLAGLFAGVAGSLAAINIELAQASFVGAAQSGAVLLATYIGGVAFFVGPVLGAILVTLLSIKLSDFSEIWVLYFGILFVTIILFAPYGLSGILMMHVQFWRGPIGKSFARLFRLLGAYLVAAIPALIMLAGGILLIEMIHHVAQKGAEGANMHFLRRSYLTINTHTVLPWVGAVVALIAGFFAFRFTWPTVANAWNNALADAKRSQP